MEKIRENAAEPPYGRQSWSATCRPCRTERAICGGAGARGAMALEPGHGPAASNRCEVTRHCASASRGRVFQQPHLVSASPRCSPQPAPNLHTALPATPHRSSAPMSARVVLPSRTMTAGSSMSGRVVVEQHRACHPRVRLLEALPGRARQQQLRAGRGLADPACRRSRSRSASPDVQRRSRRATGSAVQAGRKAPSGFACPIGDHPRFRAVTTTPCSSRSATSFQFRLQ
jgi:hypothetical protein